MRIEVAPKQHRIGYRIDFDRVSIDQAKHMAYKTYHDVIFNVAKELLKVAKEELKRREELVNKAELVKKLPESTKLTDGTSVDSSVLIDLSLKSFPVEKTKEDIQKLKIFIETLDYLCKEHEIELG